MAVPHWFSSQEWQRKVRSHRRLLEFSQKRKPPNLRSCFLFIYILFFSEEKIPKPEEPRAHKLTKCKTKSLDIWRTTVSEKLMSAFMIRIVRQNAPDTVTNPVNGTKFSFSIIFLLGKLKAYFMKTSSTRIYSLKFVPYLQ